MAVQAGTRCKILAQPPRHSRAAENWGRAWDAVQQLHCCLRWLQKQKWRGAPGSENGGLARCAAAASRSQRASRLARVSVAAATGAAPSAVAVPLATASACWPCSKTTSSSALICVASYALAAYTAAGAAGSGTTERGLQRSVRQGRHALSDEQPPYLGGLDKEAAA